ncbi:MAG TPA: hypothetical protein DDZ41_06455 [Flavobacterium sp.]|nr:hypothetical protein [Flavobacterium sp.]
MNIKSTKIKLSKSQVEAFFLFKQLATTRRLVCNICLKTCKFIVVICTFSIKFTTTFEENK